MTKKVASQSFSDNFWSNSSDSNLFSTPSSISLNRKRNNLLMQEFVHSVDESPEFHDPYSDLSLFLSDTIKKEMGHIDSSNRWTLKIQEELITRITPEFQKRFPQYRLGVSALKKIWNKIVFYREQIQDKTEALDQDGKLNVNFFIKENLRQYFQQKAASFLNPYQCAHQIASKMSECIATLEGRKPKLDLLTQTIWALQKHLLNVYPLQQSKTPYDEFNKIDKLIVKTILEITAKNPHIGMKELEHQTKESLQALHDLPDFSSTDKVTCNVSAILAEKFYATSSFHFRFFAEQKNGINNFIKKHSSLYKSSIARPELPDLVRRIMALYTLASQMPKNITKELLYEAVEALFKGATQRPLLDQSVYAFLSAELLLTKDPLKESSLEVTQKTVWESYQETAQLPIFQGHEKELLEVIIWKLLSETEGFLERLPYRIGQKIEEEIAHILINDPSKGFSTIIHETVDFFKKVKELTEHKKWNETDKKIHIWCIQNDMLCRSIRLNLDNPLAKIILQKFSEKMPTCHSSFISEVCQDFLKNFPEMTIYMAQLSSKAWALYKYMWFTTFSKSDESSFDRFLKWHIPLLKAKDTTHEELLKRLEELCKKCIPLIPFDSRHILETLSSFQKNKDSP